MPARKEMPRTIRRSPRKAQRTWEKAHDSAVGTYGEGEAAHRVAYAALKHGHEKVGDHWEPKTAKGPSDPRAAQPTRDAIGGRGETFGGVDYAGHTRDELLARAKDLGVPRVSRMTKRDLARAIARKQK
jgi:hypothetical protein